ncbi:hypothetical protein F1654_01510 [Alkalicaulis satelles]|uniref:Glycoside hydrolase family 5 protein n=1 Tax=Alkalicaulis satelles TaxID=2609175 RepID=A0A5M6ZLZ4_9PROT|nr:hypothetical protein [Alkalicaulis satelles]KAA5804707.1 hypothetical protein F1654_01510 [Alkalicaulis satelles]
MITRRSLLTGLSASAAVTGAAGAAPGGLRLTSPKRALWNMVSGPHLRGAVIVQRRVYPSLDGDTFLGAGPIGAPVTNAALDALAEAGANLISWSGPGPFAETAPHDPDPAVVDHIADWLDRCRARGLYTTLCLRSGPGRSAFAFHPDETWFPPELYDVSIWSDEDKQAAWAAMTAWTLRTFGSHPALAGVVAMDEPNGIDEGRPGVWEPLAARIAGAVAAADADRDTPLLLSPDRWARTAHARDLRAAVGPGPILALHDYEPWEYTHQASGDRLGFSASLEPVTLPDNDLGAWSMLEFGAVRYAPDLGDYLEDRIAAFERSGANWAAFRWTHGWQAYEAREDSMNMAHSETAMTVMRRAWSGNTRRPS